MEREGFDEASSADELMFFTIAIYLISASTAELKTTRLYQIALLQLTTVLGRKAKGEGLIAFT